ncbi:MAG: hypothetical protein HKL85_07045 [Acidimicrobiaceae bacterium]|nr:hypothetical protein [Acidimicrobiaceae bacterium]
MCRRITCSKCGRPTWAGCGQHVEQVLGGVPKSKRCNCAETGMDSKVKKALTQGWLSRIFGD